MIDKPPLSILIPWYERDELRLTLAANAPVFRSSQAEVLVVNCGGNSERVRHLIAESEATGIRQLDISAPRFNKALALNVGLAHSRSDTICVLDADVTLLADTLTEATALTEDRSLVTIEWVYESESVTPNEAKQPNRGNNFSDLTNNVVVSVESSTFVEFHFRDDTTLQHQVIRQDVFGTRRAGLGLLVAAKRDLLEIQGYNSDLQGWGWEDDDVVVRLQHVLGLRRVQKGEALHLSHGDDRRILHGSRRQSDQINFMKCCRNYNNGLFTGTYLPDIAWAADKVAEMPIK